MSYMSIVTVKNKNKGDIMNKIIDTVAGRLMCTTGWHKLVPTRREYIKNSLITLDTNEVVPAYTYETTYRCEYCSKQYKAIAHTPITSYKVQPYDEGFVGGTL